MNRHRDYNKEHEDLSASECREPSENTSSPEDISFSEDISLSEEVQRCERGLKSKGGESDDCQPWWLHEDASGEVAQSIHPSSDLSEPQILFSRQLLNGDFSFNPFDYRFHENPKDVYRHLRNHAPVHYNETLNLYVLSRYADVIVALKSDDIYSFCHSDTYEAFHPEKFADLVGFFCQDGLVHSQQRQLAGRPFTPQKARSAAPTVTRFCEYYLDCALDKVRRRGGGIELMNDIAGPISMAIIAELIGFPPQWRDRIRGWIDLTVSRDNGSAVVQPAALQASEQLLKYLYEFWESRKKIRHEEETIADRMIRSVDQGLLSKQHAISFLWALCFAGQEATAKLFGNAVYLASQHRLIYFLHRSADVVDDFLVEVMRFDSPAQIVYRTLKSDHEHEGVLMHKGARVGLLLGSANVDERMFGPDAGAFRVGRSRQSELLTFGWGTHYCLGRALGEIEVRLCLQKFFERVRSYRIDDTQCVRVHTSTVHGFSRLPLSALDLA